MPVSHRLAPLIALLGGCFSPDMDASTGAPATTDALDPSETGTTSGSTADHEVEVTSQASSADASTTTTGTDDTGTTGDGTACPPSHFGPACTPCSCAHGTCDDGLAGSGACTCAPGWTGSRCSWDCGPGGTLHDDGTCTTPLATADDAFVCSGDWADLVLGDGASTTRAVGRQNDFTGNQIGRALFRFELADLPSGIAVEHAVLTLTEYDNFAGFPMDVEIRRTAASWNEGNVTWSSQPMAASDVLDTASVGCCGESHAFAVTDAVVDALADDHVALSLMLRSTDEATVGGVRWWFREGDGVVYGELVGAQPVLTLHYAVP